MAAMRDLAAIVMPGLEIATDTVANATTTFNLATKNSSVVATSATMFPLQLKNKVEEKIS